MTQIVVDASVWVAAADSTDRFSAPSRDFLKEAMRRHESLAVPELTHLEVACALARRLQDAQAGRDLGRAVLGSLAEVHGTSSGLIEEAVRMGTSAFLRAGDAIYATVARRINGALVSWDDELVTRAGAKTPSSWLEENP